MGRWGRNCARIEGNPNSNCYIHVCESKIESFRKSPKNSFNNHSMGEFGNDFTVKCPLISDVKLLCYGNFILTSTVCDFVLLYSIFLYNLMSSCLLITKQCDGWAAGRPLLLWVWHAGYTIEVNFECSKSVLNINISE